MDWTALILSVVSLVGNIIYTIVTRKVYKNSNAYIVCKKCGERNYLSEADILIDKEKNNEN